MYMYYNFDSSNVCLFQIFELRRDIPNPVFGKTIEEIRKLAASNPGTTIGQHPSTMVGPKKL